MLHLYFQKLDMSLIIRLTHSYLKLKYIKFLKTFFLFYTAVESNGNDFCLSKSENQKY